MSKNTFISKEIDKIINNQKYEFPLNIAMSSAWLMAHFKGLNLKIIQVKDISSIADYFIIGSANNPVQAFSMSDELIHQLKQRNQPLISREGGRDSDWILLDFGDIIVHIFQDSVREVFDMEELWKDAPHVAIPNEFYQSGVATNNEDDRDSNKDYF